MEQYKLSRRSLPIAGKIRQGMGANDHTFKELKKQCELSGIKMTDLRCLILHGCLKAGHGATAEDIWKTTVSIVDGHAPSIATLQRNLRIFVQHGVLLRDIGHARSWCYRLRVTQVRVPTVNLIDNSSGQQTACDAPELERILKHIAVEHGFCMHNAFVIITGECQSDLD